MDCQVKLPPERGGFCLQGFSFSRVGVACKYMPGWQVHDGEGWKDSALMLEQEERGVSIKCVFTYSIWSMIIFMLDRMKPKASKARLVFLQHPASKWRMIYTCIMSSCDQEEDTLHLEEAEPKSKKTKKDMYDKTQQKENNNSCHTFIFATCMPDRNWVQDPRQSSRRSRCPGSAGFLSASVTSFMHSD